MTSTLPQPYTPNTSPTIPRNQLGWADAIVKWTREDSVDVWMYPNREQGDSMMRVYKGDMIQVSPKHRKEEWCLVQVGHVMGWMNTADVRFLMQGRSAVIERETVHSSAPAPKPEMPPVQAISSSINEEETQPALPPVQENPKVSMLKKLISFFKN